MCTAEGHFGHVVADVLESGQTGHSGGGEMRTDWTKIKWHTGFPWLGFSGCLCVKPKQTQYNYFLFTATIARLDNFFWGDNCFCVTLTATYCLSHGTKCVFSMFYTKFFLSSLFLTAARSTERTVCQITCSFRCFTYQIAYLNNFKGGVA